MLHTSLNVVVNLDSIICIQLFQVSKVKSSLCINESVLIISELLARLQTVKVVQEGHEFSRLPPCHIGEQNWRVLVIHVRLVVVNANGLHNRRLCLLVNVD